jgi:membrane associated rhomboid family serine protease
MAEVAFHRGPSESVVDACERCLLVWFDAHEFDPLPERPPAPPRERLSPAAAEGLVRLRAKEAKEGWVDEFHPGDPGGVTSLYTGFALDGDRVERPWLTRSFVVVLVVVTLVGLFVRVDPPPPEGSILDRLKPRPSSRPAIVAWVERWAFLPSEPFRAGGATAVTSFFLHGSVLHVFGNALVLLFVGGMAEALFGRLRYPLLLLGGAAAGCLFYGLANPGSDVPLVGASGGISAFFGACALARPGARMGFVSQTWHGRDLTDVGWFSALPRFVVLRVPLIWAFPVWFLYQVLLAQVGAGQVAYEAHVGGALFGVAWVLWIALRPRARREED